jgi:hypothetical protein
MQMVVHRNHIDAPGTSPTSAMSAILTLLEEERTSRRHRKTGVIDPHRTYADCSTPRKTKQENGTQNKCRRLDLACGNVSLAGHYDANAT